VACLKPEHGEIARAALGTRKLPIQIHAGKTPEIIEAAHSCMACSGSVSLELLYRRKPTTIVYRQHWTLIGIAYLVKTSKYITLVNLLADKELYPEYFGWRCFAPELSGHILRWLDQPEEHARVIAELTALRERVAVPGAGERAARRILDLVAARQRRAA
jgi:lipid-A-disaccharide synthase